MVNQQYCALEIKWIASDIPRGLTTGLASEYNEKYSLH